MGARGGDAGWGRPQARGAEPLPPARARQAGQACTAPPEVRRGHESESRLKVRATRGKGGDEVQEGDPQQLPAAPPTPPGCVWPRGQLRSGSGPHRPLDEAQRRLPHHARASRSCPLLLHPGSAPPPGATEALAAGPSPRRRKPCKPQEASPTSSPGQSPQRPPRRPGPLSLVAAHATLCRLRHFQGSPGLSCSPKRLGTTSAPRTGHSDRDRDAQGCTWRRRAASAPWEAQPTPVNHQMAGRCAPKATRCGENRDCHL